jgi:hypothetical protein
VRLDGIGYIRVNSDAALSIEGIARAKERNAGAASPPYTHRQPRRAAAKS